MTDVADAFREAFLEGMQKAVKVLRAAKPGIHTQEIEKYIAQECRDYWDDYNEQVWFAVSEGELTDEEVAIIVSPDTVESLGKFPNTFVNVENWGTPHTGFVDIEACPIVEGGFTMLGEVDVDRFKADDRDHASMVRFLGTVVASKGDDHRAPPLKGWELTREALRSMGDKPTIKIEDIARLPDMVEAKGRRLNTQWAEKHATAPLHGINVEVELFDMLMEEIEREGVVVSDTTQIDADVKEEMLANAVRRIMPAHLVGNFEGISPMRAPSTEVHKRRPPTVEMPQPRPVVMKEVAFTPTEMAARVDHTHRVVEVTGLTLATDDAPFKVVEVQDGREVCSATFPQFKGFRPDRHMQVQSKLCDQSMTDEKSSISLRSVSFR